MSTTINLIVLTPIFIGLLNMLQEPLLLCSPRAIVIMQPQSHCYFLSAVNTISKSVTLVNFAKQIRPCNRNCVKNLGVADQLNDYIYLQLLGPINTILETATRLF